MQKSFQTTLDGSTPIENWDFAHANTGYLTHSLHDYPARMIPQIAKRLIERYSSTNDTILDPFCGSGTTLVEAKLNYRNAVGLDANPLAVLLTKVKSNNLKLKKFDAPTFLKELEQKYQKLKNSKKLPEPPLEILPNLLHWFKPQVAGDLEFLFQFINDKSKREIHDFLYVVLSKTIFKSSNIDHHSSRFIRVLHDKELKKLKPNAIKNFRENLIESLKIMTSFHTELENKGGVKTKITAEQGDARNLKFSKNSFDCIITSPPYGEEKNTLDYLRWSKLSLAWLRLNSNGNKICLGSKHSTNIENDLEYITSKTAEKVINKVITIDKKRASDAIPFFLDYITSLKEMHRVLKKNSICCIVIGNRSMKKIPIDMEKTTVEFAESVGFLHEKSYFRKLPIKLIPWDTPTGKTISRESMIILRKG